MHGGNIDVTDRTRVQREIPPDLLHAMREIVRYAIMTLAALRDPDARYLGLAQMPQNVVHDVKEAYGYASVSVRSFQPTPYEIQQMDTVLPWLAWLRREDGDTAVRRIIAWAMGAALWRIGQREGCSDRTILNRIDRSICKIVRRFAGADLEVEEIEEPYKGAKYALVYERPGTIGGEVKIMKVYVGGQGYFKGSRRLRDGTERFAETATT
jgi:hypothetical protein